MNQDNANYDVIHFCMVSAVRAESFYGVKWNKAFKVRFNEGEKALGPLSIEWTKEYVELQKLRPDKYVLHSDNIAQYVKQKVSEGLTKLNFKK